MAGFIHLTYSSTGGEVLLNPEHIILMTPDTKNGTWITSIQADNLHVKEDLNEVLNKLYILKLDPMLAVA